MLNEGGWFYQIVNGGWLNGVFDVADGYRRELIEEEHSFGIMCSRCGEKVEKGVAFPLYCNDCRSYVDSPEYLAENLARKL